MKYTKMDSIVKYWTGILLQRRRRRRQSSGDTSSTNGDITHRKSFLFLLMALYLLRVWGTSRFIINILTKQLKKDMNCIAQYILLLLQSYGDSGQGFWNFIIFCCLDKAVKFRLLFGCCSRRDENAENADRETQRLLHNIASDE